MEHVIHVTKPVMGRAHWSWVSPWRASGARASCMLLEFAHELHHADVGKSAIEADGTILAPVEPRAWRGAQEARLAVHQGGSSSPIRGCSPVMV